MHQRNTSLSAIATATLSAIFIRPAVIATNACQLVIVGLLALALHLFSSPDGRMLSLLQTWAAASWFQISRNLIAYLPEWLASRMIGNLTHQMLFAAAFRRLSLGKKTIPFFCYMDECQNYINETVITGLSEARKFGFHYILANQYLNQNMTLTQQKAILNCNVKICGNVNYEDGVRMAKEMGLRDGKAHFRWLKAGEFFVHVKGRMPGFVRWPNTFALPSSLVGRCRHSVYMREGHFRVLMKQLREKVTGAAVSDPSQRTTQPSQQKTFCHPSEVSQTTKITIIHKIDTSRFKLHEI